MLTDWVLIARLAEELQEKLRGGRVADAGLLADGRIAVIFTRRRQRIALVLDLFASPPLLTLEEQELGVLEEPGFVRAVARALRGMTLDAVNSRRFDRLLRLQFSSRSRFGVGDALEIYLELVPRFGNAVLVKGETVVAAYKEFSPAQNPRRPIAAGLPYVPPPLPAQARALDPAPEGSVLELFARERDERVRRAQDTRNAGRRESLLRRLSERERKLRRELTMLADKRSAADRREALRAQGEAIFATLHALDERDREAAKERAAEVFGQYKKLGKSLPHVVQRERAVTAALDIVDALRWEAERAADEDLADVESAVAALEPRRRPASPAVARRRKRRPLELRTPGGSRIVIGRSPVENAEITFHIARPDDLWFHARGIPGAHVILARDERDGVPAEDLQTAASLAAFYSKAQAAATAAVDYTLRKHVRKQRDAPPGLVWYTHAKTIVSTPRSLDDSVRAAQDEGRDGKDTGL